MDAAVSRIESFRDFYARLIVAAAGVSSDAQGLVSAFRSVPRERLTMEKALAVMTLKIRKSPAVPGVLPKGMRQAGYSPY